jgi:hypothetical protein
MIIATMNNSDVVLSYAGGEFQIREMNVDGDLRTRTVGRSDIVSMAKCFGWSASEIEEAITKATEEA